MRILLKRYAPNTGCMFKSSVPYGIKLDVLRSNVKLTAKLFIREM